MARADASPESLSYEPKWDGYRCVAIHDDHGVTLWSGQGKQLTGYLPELVETLASGVPPVRFSAKPRSGPGQVGLRRLAATPGQGWRSLP